MYMMGESSTAEYSKTEYCFSECDIHRIVQEQNIQNKNTHSQNNLFSHRIFINEAH